MLHAEIIGHLGGDPESRYTSTGTPFCSFSVASTDGTGERKKTEWVRVTAWNKTAELCQQYLVKGRQVYVAGRLNSRSYDAANGEKRFSLELTADTVQFIGPAPDRNGQAAEPVTVAAEESDLDSIPF